MFLFLSKKKLEELINKISNDIYNKLSNRLSAIETKNDNLSMVTPESIKDLHEVEKRKVAYALNLCTVSVSQIIDYNDIYILEQEYDAILNNLHLQNFIKDEPLLKVLKQILDTITFFKIQEGDKKFIEKEYQQKMKNAIWSAVPNLSIIFAGGNPITMAVAVASQIGVGYMNYRRNKNQYALDREKQEWELQRSAIEQFNGLRRELFETAWRLSDTYKFPDKYRLTEKQISRYNAILLDNDPLRRFEKLDVISDTFQAFPPFWYYMGNAAKEIYSSVDYKNTNIEMEYKNKALKAYEKFDEIYKDFMFMREDIIAASCALDHISLLDPKSDKEEIERLLNRAVGLAGDNFDVLQICVLTYVAIGDINSAKNTLRKLINENYNIGLNGLLLSRIYCKFDRNEVDYKILKKRIGETNVMPWIEDDEESEKGYIEYRKNDVSWRFKEFLEDITNKYKNTFMGKLGYSYYDEPPVRINWFKEIGMIDLLINHLNSYFDELSQLNLFNIQKRKNNESWKEFFDVWSKNIGESINEFNKKLIETQKFIGKYDVHTVMKHHKENMVMCEKISAILQLANFCSFTEEFIKKLYEEFDNNFSVKSAESADNIIDSINSWYEDNKINIPKKNSKYEQNIFSSGNSQKKYFVYKDIIKT